MVDQNASKILPESALKRLKELKRSNEEQPGTEIVKQGLRVYSKIVDKEESTTKIIYDFPIQHFQAFDDARAQVVWDMKSFISRQSNNLLKSSEKEEEIGFGEYEPPL